MSAAQRTEYWLRACKSDCGRRHRCIACKALLRKLADLQKSERN